MFPLGKVYTGDCVELMQKLPDSYIDLTVTSPPYDNLRKYNGYSFNFGDTATQLYRVTKTGGVVVWVVGDATIKGSETGTSFKQALYFMQCGFNLLDTMIYKVPGTGAKGSNNCYWQSFEYMFVLTKGKIKTVNRLRDKVNVKAGTKCTSNLQNREGVNTRKHPAGGTVVSELGIRENVWVIPAGNGHSEYTGHVACFPEALARDHILSWSNPGDLIFDPFSGSGTTGKMALLNNRKFLGFEISEEYTQLANNRIRNSVFDGL